MKEKTVFWLFTLIFISLCVIVLLLCDITRRSDDIYIKEITVTEITQASGKAVKGQAENALVDADNSAASAKININTASAEELTALPGIGEAIAERIVKYREENGAFGSIEEITEVSGIGESKFEAVREFITV